MLQHIWDQIHKGAADPAHPYHSPAFGTLGSNGPNVRTIILRRAELEARSLCFHSDRRAQKINEIQKHPRVALHFWNSDSREQLRITGNATVHFDDQIANQLWQHSRPKSLITYVKPTTPGTKVDQPESGIVGNFQSGNVSMSDVEVGRQHFAVVCTQVDEIDFLQLHNEGNCRAYFQWESGRYEGAWLIP
nr:pyridoxamine 5'-phosphate oxidase family protein [Oculatella sp. LEGE 06141]